MRVLISGCVFDHDSYAFEFRVGGAIAITFEHWRLWSSASESFAGLIALDLTGIIAALALLLLAGSRATIRHLTV